MSNSTDVLDVIERRIIALEKLLIPKGYTKSKDEESIIDKLTQTHSMVMTALVQREAVINILQRLSELNRLLDPYNFSDYDVETMYKMLLTLYPLLKVMAVEAGDFIELRRCEDSKYLDQIFELQDKVQKVYSINSELHTECSNITQSIIKCLQDNFNIINSLSEVFARLDSMVSSIHELQHNLQDEMNEE